MDKRLLTKSMKICIYTLRISIHMVEDKGDIHSSLDKHKTYIYLHDRASRFASTFSNTANATLFSSFIAKL